MPRPRSASADTAHTLPGPPVRAARSCTARVPRPTICDPSRPLALSATLTRERARGRITAGREIHHSRTRIQRATVLTPPTGWRIRVRASGPIYEAYQLRGRERPSTAFLWLRWQMRHRCASPRCRRKRTLQSLTALASPFAFARSRSCATLSQCAHPGTGCGYVSVAVLS